MKQLLLFVPPIVAAITSCQPVAEKAGANPESNAGKASVGNLARLTGTWISRSRNGFTLLRINPDSTGTFTWYRDSAKGDRPAYPSAQYSFGEMPAKVRYRPQTGPIRYVPNIEVQIWSNGARSDYELIGDTLREIDKMGYQGTLVRLHSKPAS